MQSLIAMNCLKSLSIEKYSEYHIFKRYDVRTAGRKKPARFHSDAFMSRQRKQQTGNRAKTMISKNVHCPFGSGTGIGFLAGKQRCPSRPVDAFRIRHRGCEEKRQVAAYARRRYVVAVVSRDHAEPRWKFLYVDTGLTVGFSMTQPVGTFIVGDDEVECTVVGRISVRERISSSLCVGIIECFKHEFSSAALAGARTKG